MDRNGRRSTCIVDRNGWRSGFQNISTFLLAPSWYYPSPSSPFPQQSWRGTWSAEKMFKIDGKDDKTSGVQRKCLKLMEELKKNLRRCKLSVTTPGFFLPLSPTLKCIQCFMFVAKTFKSWIMNLYYISNLSRNSKLMTSSGLPSDSAAEKNWEECFVLHYSQHSWDRS